MARRFRRRKGPRGAWFPTLQPITTGLAVAGDGSATLDAIGLLEDGLDDQIEQNPFDDVVTLNDVINGTGYHIKRIVGQQFCWVDAVADADLTNQTSARIDVIWGIAVLDVDQQGQPLNLDKFEYTAATNNYSAPMQRWITQRMWVLNPNGNAGMIPGQYPVAQSRNFYEGLPRSNMQYGDMRSGPHFDVKCSALVRPGQRVFMLRWVRGVSLGTEAADRWVNFVGNLRMYATMRPNLRRS